MADTTSTFTIRGLKKALKFMDPRQTVLIRGRHGIGKSAVAYEAAEEWGLTKVIERRISQLSEGDMIGLPDRGAVKNMRGSEEKVTSFLPTDWFLQAELEPVLVFLDEINRGTPEVMQACFQFIEKGELNGRKIHPKSRIIAAINNSKEYHVTPMDPAFVSRFWVVDLEPDKKDWIDWARGSGNIHEDVVDFIAQCNSDDFEIMPEKMAQRNPNDVMPTRRSWERFARHIGKEREELENKSLLDVRDIDAIYNLGRGFVGPDASRAFVKFIGDRAAHITPEDILGNFEKVQKRVQKMKNESLVELIEKIQHHISSKKIKLNEQMSQNLADFMKAIPPEIGTSVWLAVAKTDVENTRMFSKFGGKYFVGELLKTKTGQIIKKAVDNK